MKANEKSVIDLSYAGVKKARAEAREVERLADLLTTLTQVIGNDPQLLRDVLEITYARLRDSETPACPYAVMDIMELYEQVVLSTGETVFDDGEYHHTLAQLYAAPKNDDVIQFTHYFTREKGVKEDSYLRESHWKQIPMHSLESSDFCFTDGTGDEWHICEFAECYINTADKYFARTKPF